MTSVEFFIVIFVTFVIMVFGMLVAVNLEDWRKCWKMPKLEKGHEKLLLDLIKHHYPQYELQYQKSGTVWMADSVNTMVYTVVFEKHDHANTGIGCDHEKAISFLFSNLFPAVYIKEKDVRIGIVRRERIEGNRISVVTALKIKRIVMKKRKEQDEKVKRQSNSDIENKLSNIYTKNI